MNIKDEITKCYSGIIGQSKLVANRILTHASFAMGSDSPCNVLFTGEAGLGKSEMLRAELLARAKAVEIRYQRGAHVEFFQTPQEFRLVGAPFFQMVKGLVEGDGMIVDELHEVQLRPTVQIGKFLLALKQLMDNGKGKSRSVQLDDSTIVQRAQEEVFFACGTNYPQTIKDGPALISRFGGEMPLALYSEEELTKILSKMASNHGVHIHENTLALLAKCGRGTARPLESIVSHLVKVARVEGKKTINRAEALQAMQDLSLYPTGVSEREVSIMVNSKNAGLPIRFIPIKFAIEEKASKQSLSFLASRGYITISGPVCVLTPRGATYLENLRADKFKLPN
jgi:Holliday junction resolvasome RuvABC ATP-dependent DNA helicase subunit